MYKRERAGGESEEEEEEDDESYMKYSRSLILFGIVECFHIKNIFSLKLIKNLLGNAPLCTVQNFNRRVRLSITARYFIKIPTWENKISADFFNTCCFIFYYTRTDTVRAYM